MKTTTMLARVALMIVAPLVMACSTAQSLPDAPPQAVQAERVSPDPAVRGGVLRYSAVVEPETEVPLSFRVPGYVIALRQVRGEDGRTRDVAEGDRVSKGVALVRIRAAEYEDRVRQARSQASAAEALALKAQLDFDRATRLYASDSMTRPDFDAARAQSDATRSQLEAARASTSEAEIALRDTAVVAPFDADVVKKDVELGGFVSPGSAVLVLARTDVVTIAIGVPDTVVRSVRLGQAVDVTIDAYADRAFRARVTRIASAADPRTRMFEVEIAIPNRDHALKAGMIGALQLAVGDAGPQPAVLRVPLSALVRVADGRYGVFVVADSPAGGLASLRPVEIGNVSGSAITIVSGLSAGDQVITTGANLLKDRQRVEVVK